MWWRRGIAVIYATNEESAKKVLEALKENGYPAVLFKYSLENVERAWSCYDAIVFIMALGGVVRTVCRFAQGKDRDPSVVTVDDGLKFVIPVLGSHWGSNKLAEELAKALNSTPVITTASEQSGVTSIEELANTLIAKVINVNAIVKVTSALLRGENVCVKGLKELPKGVRGSYLIGEGCKYNVVVTDKVMECRDENTVCLKLLKVAVGVGAKKEASPTVIKEAVFHALDILSLTLDRVSVIASLRDSVESVSKELGVPFRKITSEEINSFNDDCLTPPSEKLSELGLKGVAEVSALISGGNGAKLILRKIQYKREVTVAVATVGEQ